MTTGLDTSRLAITFSNIGHTFTHTTIILYATAVLHLPGVFDVSYGELLKLSSPGLILYGVAALPAGWLGDRWSKVGMMVVFFFGLGAGAVITGVSQSTTGLLIGLTLLGLFAAIYHPVGIAWLVACARKQGLTLGLNGVFGNLGSAIAPVFVGIMIDYVSWRAAFIVPGLLAILTGIALVAAAMMGRVEDAQADRDPSSQTDSGSFWRVFVVLTITVACGGFVYTGLMTTVPKIFETGLGEGLGTSYTTIGLFAGGVIGLASIGSVMGGWLADRYSARVIYLTFWGLSVLPLLFVTSLSGSGLILVMLIALTFNVTFAAAENMLVARYSPFKWRALAYGMRFVLALGVGGLTVQLAGDLFDRSGNFSSLYLMFGIAAVVAAIGAWVLPEPKAATSSALS